MIVAVASGKGGTGKTTIAVNLALSIGNVQLLDCDVEEPNAHIFLKPNLRKKNKAFIPVPEIDKTLCKFCGRCKEVCVYNAIAVFPSVKQNNGNILVFPQLCHGCGACSYFCMEKAIKEVNREIGTVETGEAGNVAFIQGKLNIGESMSPPLIRQVKKHIDKEKTVIIDSPPGTSCPVIESIKGSDFCILVTEPTPFGLNDLLLAVEVVKKLAIPFGVIINRADLGDKKTDKYCEKEHIPIIAKFKFEKKIAIAYSNGSPVVKAFPEYKKDYLRIFNNIKNITGNIA
ncbi:MAG: ATP-binding protein [bacterium]